MLMTLNSTPQTRALHSRVVVITKLLESVEQPGCLPSSPPVPSQLIASGFLQHQHQPVDPKWALSLPHCVCTKGTTEVVVPQS